MGTTRTTLVSATVELFGKPAWIRNKASPAKGKYGNNAGWEGTDGKAGSEQKDTKCRIYL